MFKTLLLTAFLLGSGAERSTDLTILIGTVVHPAGIPLSEPVQVLLLSPDYVNVWSADLQKRIDLSWERYKPALAERREFFLDIQRMAYRDSIQYVMSVMRRELRDDMSGLLQMTSPEGRFEFRSIPLGEYRVIAFGKVGQREVIWQQPIHISSPVPQFLEVTNHIP